MKENTQGQWSGYRATLLIAGSEPCLDQLALFPTPLGNLNPCTKKGYWSQVAQVSRLWKAGAAITSAEGTTCWSEPRLAVRNPAIPGFCPLLSLPPKDLLPVGWSSDPHPASPAGLWWIFSNPWAQEPWPLSSSQKSQGHIGCGTWGLVGTVTFLRTWSFEHGGTLCTLPTLPKVEQELGRQGCRSYF